jgi:hypothetical protein
MTFLNFGHVSALLTLKTRWRGNRGKRRKRVSMECDICRTLAQQLRSYEMEIEDARNGSSAPLASVVAGSLLNNALEEASKTKLLYQHHREKFHQSARICPTIQSAAVAVHTPGSLLSNAEGLGCATPFWPDDLSGLSHEAVLNYLAENRAWNKRLREGTAALVNTRLAKTITQEEYASNRKRTTQDAAECFRRASMLVKDMAIRERGLSLSSDSSERATFR